MEARFNLGCFCSFYKLLGWETKRIETKEKRNYTELLIPLASFTLNFGFKVYFLMQSQTAPIFSNLTISAFLFGYLPHLQLIQLLIYSSSSYCISWFSNLFSCLQLFIFSGEKRICYSVYVVVRGQLWESVLSYPMGFWFQTQVTGLAGRCSPAQSHLTGLCFLPSSPLECFHDSVICIVN